MKTITFDDGYTVTIDRHLVRFAHGGKQQFAQVAHWKPVPEDSAAARFLEKKGKDISDYLFSKPTQRWMVIRAGNGVREAIQEALEEFRALEAGLNREDAFVQRIRPSK